MMDDLEFREISLRNLDEIIELRVRPDQVDLVADNLYSIAQAALDPDGECRGVYVAGRPVGFFYTRSLNDGRLRYVCRFMIDQREQGRGLGRRTMQRLIEEAFASATTEMVDLAVSPGPGSAAAFYEQCGFVPTGEAYRGGVRMVVTRERFPALRFPSQGAGLRGHEE